MDDRCGTGDSFSVVYAFVARHGCILVEYTDWLKSSTNIRTIQTTMKDYLKGGEFTEGLCNHELDFGYHAVSLCEDGYVYLIAASKHVLMKDIEVCIKSLKDMYAVEDHSTDAQDFWPRVNDLFTELLQNAAVGGDAVAVKGDAVEGAGQGDAVAVEGDAGAVEGDAGDDAVDGEDEFPFPSPVGSPNDDDEEEEESSYEFQVFSDDDDEYNMARSADRRDAGDKTGATYYSYSCLDPDKDE